MQVESKEISRLKKLDEMRNANKNLDSKRYYVIRCSTKRIFDMRKRKQTITQPDNIAFISDEDILKHPSKVYDRLRKIKRTVYDISKFNKAVLVPDIWIWVYRDKINSDYEHYNELYREDKRKFHTWNHCKMKLKRIAREYWGDDENIVKLEFLKMMKLFEVLKQYGYSVTENYNVIETMYREVQNEKYDSMDDLIANIKRSNFKYKEKFNEIRHKSKANKLSRKAK